MKKRSLLYLLFVIIGSGTPLLFSFQADASSFRLMGSRKFSDSGFRAFFIDEFLKVTAKDSRLLLVQGGFRRQDGFGGQGQGPFGGGQVVPPCSPPPGQGGFQGQGGQFRGQGQFQGRGPGGGQGQSGGQGQGPFGGGQVMPPCSPPPGQGGFQGQGGQFRGQGPGGPGSFQMRRQN